MQLPDVLPVLHALRKDGTVIIATRIPLGDIRLQNWGWILALSNQNDLTEDDIETLTDKSGKRYPKVYFLKDVLNYAERWGCSEWEEGYQDGNVSWLAKSNGVAGSEVVRESTFQQALIELQARQQEQLGEFQNQLLTQVGTISDAVGTNHAKLGAELEETIINSHNRLLEQFRLSFEGTSRQLSTLSTEFTSSRQVEETALNGIASQTQKSYEEMNAKELLSQ